MAHPWPTFGPCVARAKRVEFRNDLWADGPEWLLKAMTGVVDGTRLGHFVDRSSSASTHHEVPARRIEYRQRSVCGQQGSMYPSPADRLQAVIRSPALGHVRRRNVKTHPYGVWYLGTSSNIQVCS